jgi:hypothetical protein
MNQANKTIRCYRFPKRTDPRREGTGCDSDGVYLEIPTEIIRGQGLTGIIDAVVLTALVNEHNRQVQARTIRNDGFFTMDESILCLNCCELAEYDLHKALDRLKKYSVAPYHHESSTPGLIDVRWKSVGKYIECIAFRLRIPEINSLFCVYDGELKDSPDLEQFLAEGGTL